MTNPGNVPFHQSNSSLPAGRSSHASAGRAGTTGKAAPAHGETPPNEIDGYPSRKVARRAALAAFAGTAWLGDHRPRESGRNWSAATKLDNHARVVVHADSLDDLVVVVGALEPVVAPLRRERDEAHRNQDTSSDSLPSVDDVTGILKGYERDE